MSLYDRLTAEEGDGFTKIGVRLLFSGLGEYLAGEVTEANIVAYFGLDAAGATELNFVITKLDGLPANQKDSFNMMIQQVSLLAEDHAPGYDKQKIKDRITNF